MSDIPTVNDFMDRKFTRVSPDTELKTALNILIRDGLLATLVVAGEDEPVGIISERDCLKILVHKAYGQRPWGLVRDHMHDSPAAIPSTMPVTEAAEIMIANGSRRFPVVDNGKLVGQITRRDLIRGLHIRFFGRAR